MPKRVADPATVERLREWFPKGSTVYTVLRGVSKSGMTRVIGVVCLRVSEDGGIAVFHPNHAVAEALGWKTATGFTDGVKVQGAGMDMGFHLVYCLAQVLYGDGYALSQRWI